MKTTDLTISLTEAARRLGIGKNQAYRAAKLGEIPTIRIGRLFLVPVTALEKMLADAVVDSDRATERSKALHDDIAAMKLEHERVIESARLERIIAQEKRITEKAIAREKNAKVFITAKVPRAMKDALICKADLTGDSLSKALQEAISQYIASGKSGS